MQCKNGKQVRLFLWQIARAVGGAGFFLLLAGCVTPPGVSNNDVTGKSAAPTTSLQQIMDMEARLDRVAGALQMANTPFCRRHERNLLGFNAQNKYSYATVPTLVAESYGLNDRLVVTGVISGGGAEKAGLRKGDTLVSIEGKPVPRGRDARAETVKMLSPLVAKGKPLLIQVERERRHFDLKIPLTLSCGFQVELGHTDGINSYSDGQRILVTQGMLNFTRDDNELAYVISKEMAHNILNHAERMKIKATTKKMIDGLIKGLYRTAPRLPAPVSRQFDVDADTLGLAMALRAGYDIDAATGFWTRLDQFSAQGGTAYTTDHPAIQERLKQMPTTISRIKSTEEKRRKAQNGEKANGR
ncbi:MAG: M48 family metalloprotease [Burkholderiaceae bacterium]|jgi:hypothetical protein|nr:M48 family metalloprotease [Burkholderiaceae bacterium]